MKVVATIGGLEVPVGSYTVSPDPLVAGTTEVVLTYELDGKTATGSQGITVNEYKTVLEENSWETIARAAAAGKAKELWNIGDTKILQLTSTSEKLKMMIVDFDHYDLASADSRYGTDYNGSSNKAGITFIAYTLPAATTTYYANTTTAHARYDTSNYKNYLENTILSAFPFETSLIPTVNIKYQGSHYQYQYTNDSDIKIFNNNVAIFPPGVLEISASTYGTLTALASNESRLAYFSANNKPTFVCCDGTAVSKLYTRDISADSDGPCIYFWTNPGTSSSRIWGQCTIPPVFIFNL